MTYLKIYQSKCHACGNKIVFTVADIIHPSKNNTGDDVFTIYCEKCLSDNVLEYAEYNIVPDVRENDKFSDFKIKYWETRLKLKTEYIAMERVVERDYLCENDIELGDY